MTRSELLRSPVVLAVAAALNVAIGVALAAGAMRPVTLVAIAPVLLVAAAALIASNRAILVFGASALDLSGIRPLRQAVLGSSVFPSDIILVLALASWAAAWLIAPGGRRPTWPRSPLLGWPLVLLAVLVGAGIVRGHERWGLSYFSQPLRFVLYAGIAFAIADLKPRDAWRGIVVVFYAGAVLNAILAVYYLGTGTVQQESLRDLSTGGTRALTLTTALYLAGAFLLALLNLEREQRFGRRLLHLTICVLAGFGIVVSYGRGVFYALGVIILVLFLTRSRLRRATLLVLPIVICALVVGSLATHGGSGFLPGLTKRITTTSDASVGWRRAANAAIWEQVQDSPIVGVGFGKGASFVVGFARYDITQDPHNSYLFLWAGGGILALASFLLLFVIFLRDSWRRYQHQADLPRTLIVWCVAFWFCIALNTLSGPWLTQANVLLTLWILMLLPMTVPYARAAGASIAPVGGAAPEEAAIGRPG